MAQTERTSAIERWAAIVLAVTALTTAWSAYQASLWGGIQTTKVAEAQTLETLASTEALAENQRRGMDGMQVLVIASALAEGKQNTINFFLPRMREELRDVIQAWLDMDPLHNQDSPAHPLLMPEYTERVLKKFKERQDFLKDGFQKNMADARASGSAADSYVLLTVMFATVLFFAGIASTFHSPRIEGAMLLVATAILCVALGLLATYPVTMS